MLIYLRADLTAQGPL